MLIFLFLLNYLGYGQTININIKDQNNLAVSQPVNIYFKENNYQNIKEFITFNKSRKVFRLTKDYKNLLIEAKAFGYKPAKFEILNIKKDSIYKISFRLIKTEQLKTVVLLSRKKISFKKDTVTYDVQHLKSKNDKKLQDLLVKLPGIEVDPSTGLIKFRGKPIETVLLDGDNLFNSNYTIGTKNINLSVIDKIQAIDHYNNNPLLRKIEKSEKAVLNLILKKNITDISGDVDVIGGVNNNLTFNEDLGIDLLGINKKYKNFSVINYNNIGIDYSPYNIFFKNDSQNEMRNYPAYNPIQTNYPVDQTQNFNHQLFVNENLLFKLSKKTGLTGNVFLLNDEQYGYNESRSVFFIGQDTLKLGGNENQILKPQVYKLNFNITSKRSSKSYFTDNFLINKQIRSDEFNIDDLYLNDVTTIQNNNALYVSNQLGLTHKIDASNAIKFTHQISYNGFDQLFIRKGSAQLNQLYKANRIVTIANMQWLRMVHESNRFNLNFEAAYHKYYLDSSIQEQQIFHNSDSYDILELSPSFSQNFKIGKTEFNPVYKLSYYKLYRSAEQSQSKFGFKVGLKTKLETNKSNSFLLFLNYNKKPLVKDRLFNFILLKDYRQSEKYISRLFFQNAFKINGQYHFTNSYPIIHFRVGFQLELNKGFLFPETSINQTETFTKYSYKPDWQHSIYYFLYFDKLLSRLKSTITFKADLFSTKNYLTTNQIKQWAENKSVSLSFNFATAFKSRFNFLNLLKYQYLFNDDFKTHIINDKLKVFYSINKCRFVIEQNTQFLDKSNHLFITNFNFIYNIKKQYEVTFKINNLFNNKFYKTIYLNDNNWNLMSYKLLPRMWLIGFTLNY